MEVLQKVARALADKWDVQVVFRGDKAYTNGKTIVVPALPEDLSAHEKTMARGYVGHERGHISFTDWEALKKVFGPLENGGPGGQELQKLHRAWNFIEDLIIERKVGREYIGEKQNMNYVAKEILKTADMKHPFMWLFAEGRRQICGYDLPGVPSYDEALKQLFGKNIFERIDKIETTKEAIDLARKLVKIYDSFKDDPQQGGQQGQSDNQKGEQGQGAGKSKGKQEGDQDGEGSGEAGDKKGDKDGKGKGSGKGKDDADKDEDGEGAGGGDQGDADGDQGDADGGQGDDGDDSDSESDQGERGKSSGRGDNSMAGGRQLTTKNNLPDITDVADPYEQVRKGLEKAHEKMLNARKYIVFDKSADTLEPMEERTDMTEFNRLRKGLGPFNAMRGKVQNMFMARTQSKWQGGKCEGRVNPKALARVPMGYQDVYRTKTVCKDRDTAVSFLIDFSGSMGNYSDGKIGAAMRAVVLLLECFEGTSIKTEVLTYTTGPASPAARKYIQERGSYRKTDYGRLEALQMKIIKGFNEPYAAKTKRRISNYQNVPKNNTPGGDVVAIAYNRLMQRTEERKILIVLTDGGVSTSGVDTFFEREYLQKVCADILKAGKAELICFGLEFDECGKYFPNTIDITNAKDLPAHIFKELRRIMKV